MTIPKKFQIFGQTINILWDGHLILENDVVGQARHRESEIAIQPHTDEYKRSREQIEQSYLHEVVHIILEQLSYDELQKDEGFVDRFANALHQVLTTSKGDLGEYKKNTRA